MFGSASNFGISSGFGKSITWIEPTFSSAALTEEFVMTLSISLSIYGLPSQ